MSFGGRFAEQLLPDQLDHLSVSFLADDLQVRRGGVAANICYGMALLGLHPVLVGAVGADFGDERLLEGDAVRDFEGVEVVVDKMSVPYLEGATIDFADTIEKQGFTIDNPNAQSSCACGGSFA